MEKLLLTPAEAADVLGLSRSKVFALIQSRRLKSVKIGGCRRIPACALKEYVEYLMREAARGCLRVGVSARCGGFGPGVTRLGTGRPTGRGCLLR